MAGTIKQTSTVNVICNVQDGSNTTFRLNDPVEELTLATVKNAFAPFFADGNSIGKNLICNVNNFELTGIERAETVETTIRTTILS